MPYYVNFSHTHLYGYNRAQITITTCIFFSKYTATHVQVTMSARSREPNDTQNPYINTRKKIKVQCRGTPS